VEHAAQEAHHVERGHVQGGVAHKVGHDLMQRSLAVEHDVGGDLGLVDDPIVAAEAPGR
jgi:hypothetical protein